MILVFRQDHRQPENLRLTMNETIAYLPGLSPVAGKELWARFDGGRLSSDGCPSCKPRTPRKPWLLLSVPDTVPGMRSIVSFL